MTEHRFGAGAVIVINNGGKCVVQVDEQGDVQGYVSGCTIYHPGQLGLEQTLLVNRSWRLTEAGLWRKE